MKRAFFGPGFYGVHLLFFSFLLFGQPACKAIDDDSSNSDNDNDSGVDAGGDTDTDTDTDTDSDTDTASEGDAGPDLPDDAEPIPWECPDAGCDGVGESTENMLCAIDICDKSLVGMNEYSAPAEFINCALEDTYEAVTHFGDSDNGLAPQMNDSYALMATGPAEGTAHSLWGTSSYYYGVPDPFSNEGYDTYDNVEWKIGMKAPEEAAAFRFKYVFFSEEYDDYISSSFNDKFYAIIESTSTNGGQKTVINFTKCREPNIYYDFICQADEPWCEEGEKYCYIAINTAYSDCCWYNGCPDGFSWDVGTDITGTGYECADGYSYDGSSHGSSTGWLQTTWPINPGETFIITFHLHDTSDGILDSEVILDAFEFLKSGDPGTGPV